MTHRVDARFLWLGVALFAVSPFPTSAQGLPDFNQPPDRVDVVPPKLTEPGTHELWAVQWYGFQSWVCVEDEDGQRYMNRVLYRPGRVEGTDDKVAWPCTVSWPGLEGAPDVGVIEVEVGNDLRPVRIRKGVIT